jgi:fluoroacetyl-CoA thioesterase
MKPSLVPGIATTLSFPIPREKTVPFLYPEAPDFVAMPEVFATGFMVGLMEWAAIRLIAPHLSPGEGSLGTHIDVSHVAATPPGMTVRVAATLERVDGRRLEFKVVAHDDLDLIGEGRHERAVVTWDRFAARVAEKLARAHA